MFEVTKNVMLEAHDNSDGGNLNKIIVESIHEKFSTFQNFEAFVL